MAKRLWAMGLIEVGVQRLPGIWLMTDGYDDRVNEDLKRKLPGPPRWSREHGRWHFPLHWDTCTGAREVADKYGADLKVTKALENWAWDEKVKQDLIPDVNAMELVDLPRVQEETPHLWEALKSRPFQTVGVAFAARNKACLIADQPGLGKTLQAIGAVIESGQTGPILVVAPKAAAQLTWPQELKRWVPNDEVVVIGSNMKTKAERVQSLVSTINHQERGSQYITGAKRRWIVVSPNYLRVRADSDQYGNYIKVKGRKVLKPVQEALLEFFDITWSAAIVDESHDTLAGVTGNKKKQPAQRQGLGALDIRTDGLRIALSGTPFRGKESYLWGQLNWLRPDLFRSYWKWCEAHFDVFNDGWGTQVGQMTDVDGIYKEASKVMIRRTKEEVAKDLPAKAYGGWPLDSTPDSPIAVWLDMEPKQAKAYNALVSDAAAELDDGLLMVNGILAELTRLKQLAGSFGKMDGDTFIPTLPSNKFEWLVEFLNERALLVNTEADAANKMPYRETPKVVVVSQFSQIIDCFADGLATKGVRTYKFTGDTSAKQREAIKDDWQNNPDSDTRVMLLSTKAGGVSLTLDAASEMVILDETWSASDQEQVEDRIHRLSRMHQVTIWKVFSRNTIEEGIARANLGKEISIKSIIDGERGVKFAKLVKGEAA